MDQLRRDYSFTVVPDELISAPLSATAKVLYMVLAQHAGKDNTCFPGQKRLMALCGVVRNTLRRAREELVEAGWLGCESRQRKDGGDTSCLYILYTSPRGQQTTPPGSNIDPPGVNGEPPTNKSLIRTRSRELESENSTPVSTLHSELYKKLSDAFYSASPDMDFKREGGALSRMVATAEQKPDPEAWLRLVLYTVWRLRKDPREKLFYERPFLPSYIMAKGIWPFVAAKLEGKERRTLTAGDIAFIGKLFGGKKP